MVFSISLFFHILLLFVCLVDLANSVDQNLFKKKNFAELLVQVFNLFYRRKN